MVWPVELTFKPGVSTRVDLERRPLFYVVDASPASIPDQERVIQNALDNPIGATQLNSVLRSGQRVVILVDDITRPTPAARILPPVLDRIAQAGIPVSDVCIFMALGTHRPMTDDELLAKLGREVLDRFRVVNRDYQAGDFVSLGQTASGTPIEIEREVLEADFKIAIGNVVPHISAGWGGGSKMLLPGVCSRNTTDAMHLMACIVQPVLEILGARDNKPRAEMDRVAERVGLDFIINTVLDKERRLLGVFAGHCIEAHRRACEMAERLMIVPIPAQADILIVSATPCHFDYWQGVKPYTYAHRAVREGGIIIFMLDGAEGLCGDAPSHEETVRKYLLWPFDDQKAAVERGEVEDLVGLNVPMYHAMIRGRVQKTICVTNHLTQTDLDALGFDAAPDVQAALEEAYGILGRQSTVGIIPFGGETLVRVAPDEFEARRAERT